MVGHCQDVAFGATWATCAQTGADRGGFERGWCYDEETSGPEARKAASAKAGGCGTAVVGLPLPVELVDLAHRQRSGWNFVPTIFAAHTLRNPPSVLASQCLVLTLQHGCLQSLLRAMPRFGCVSIVGLLHVRKPAYTGRARAGGAAGYRPRTLLCSLW